MKRFAGLPRRAWLASVAIHLAVVVGLYFLLPRLPADRAAVAVVEAPGEAFDLSLARPSDEPPADRIPFPVPPPQPPAPAPPSKPPAEPVAAPPADPGRMPTVTHVPPAMPGEMAALLRDIAGRPPSPTQARFAPTDLDIPAIPPDSPRSDVRPVEHTTPTPPGPVAPSTPDKPTIPEKFAGGKPIHGQLPDGLVVVYLLDRSTSMGLDRDTFDAARAALLATVSGQKPGAKFQVIAYQTTPEVLLPRTRRQLLTASDETLRDITEAVDALKTEGGSNHDKAVRAALELGADFIILLSDATDAEVKVVHKALNAATKPVAVYLARAANGKVAEPVALGK